MVSDREVKKIIVEVDIKVFILGYEDVKNVKIKKF